MPFQKGHKRLPNANTFQKGIANPIYKISQKAESNFNWKGDSAGKRAMHKWVEKWKGKPRECEVCGCVDAVRYDWSNVDHKYKRILDDYIRMCRKCHFAYDRKTFGKNFGYDNAQ